MSNEIPNRSHKGLIITLCIIGGTILTILIIAVVGAYAYFKKEAEIDRLLALEQEMLSYVEACEEMPMEEEAFQIVEIEESPENAIVDNNAGTAGAETSSDSDEGTAAPYTGVDDISSRDEIHHDEVIVEEPAKPEEDETVFAAVEQMPQFPGGDAEMLKFISNNIVYPAAAAENNIQGRVVVQFVVKKDGTIGEVKIARGKDPDLDKEAIRVVKSLPRFVPGKMNGQAVNVWYTLPVNFKLQG